jgi:hypothetical protein
MGLKNLIRNVIATADSVTSDLQVPVLHYAWIGNDSVYGGPLYAAPITRQAIVEKKIRNFRIESGEEILQKATITFLRPISHNGAANRQEPIDPRDKLVLDDGYTGPIKFISGLNNTFSDSPYMLEVILG